MILSSGEVEHLAGEPSPAIFFCITPRPSELPRVNRWNRSDRHIWFTYFGYRPQQATRRD
jgi:hypothetical protein